MSLKEASLNFSEKNAGNKTPVIDFHCDLLCYLSEIKGSTPLNREARCSLPQLQEGGVSLQVMAAFTETKPGSHAGFCRQIEAFKSLPSFGFSPFGQKKTVQAVLAIENASGLLEEEEPLELCFQRLDRLQKECGPILYISLTWNTENRFAGGNYATCGLKDDGKALLEYLSGKSIAIDLSHTNDTTADEILETIDSKRLKITPIASHSNFRAIKDHVRNLPDRLAIEIIRRGGVIGLNFVRAFIGEPYAQEFVKMVEHAAKLKALDHLCMGADFFYENSVPTSLNSLLPYFVSPFDTSACYPKILSLLQREVVEKIAYQNAARFLEKR